MKEKAEAKAKEIIAESWLKGGLEKLIAAALIAYGNERLEEAAKIADWAAGHEVGNKIRALREKP